MMETKEQLLFFQHVKKQLIGLDYADSDFYSSLRKLRHHLDQLILKLEKKRKEESI